MTPNIVSLRVGEVVVEVHNNGNFVLVSRKRPLTKLEKNARKGMTKRSEIFNIYFRADDRPPHLVTDRSFVKR